MTSPLENIGNSDVEGFFPKSNSLRLFVSLLVFFLFTLICLNLLENDITNMQRFMASCTLFVCFVPVLIWSFKKSEDIPAFPFMILLYSVFFAFPVFVLPKFSAHFTTARYDDVLIDASQKIVLLGLVSICLGYYLPATNLFRKDVLRLNLQWGSNEKLIWLFLIFGFVGVVFQFINRILSIPLHLQMFVNILTDLSTLSIIFLFVFIISGKYKKMASHLSIIIICSFCLFFVFRFVFSIGNQSVGEVARLLFPLCLLYVFFLRRLPLSFILFGVVLFVIIRPFKGAHFEGELLDYQKYGIFNDFFIFFRGAIDQFIDNGFQFFNDFRQSWYRLSQFGTLIPALDLTPVPIPFMEGETFSSLFTKIIPRFLYPDKPIDNLTSQFGHRYGFVGAEDFITSIRVPVLTEFYINFGKFGVLLGMFLMGLFFQFFDRFFMHLRFGIGEIVVFVFLWTKLFNPEQHLNSSIGSLIFYVPFCFSLHLFIKFVCSKESV